MAQHQLEAFLHMLLCGSREGRQHCYKKQQVRTHCVELACWQCLIQGQAPQFAMHDYECCVTFCRVYKMLSMGTHQPESSPELLA